jgi:hypothetical protein
VGGPGNGRCTKPLIAASARGGFLQAGSNLLSPEWSAPHDLKRPSSPKSSDRDQNFSKRRQQRLNRLPDPHGHRSLRPSFSMSSLSPCTSCWPRRTLVSDGYPFRRLLVDSLKPHLDLLVATMMADRLSTMNRL